MKREDVLNILIGLINDENRAIVGDIINRVNNLSDEQIKAILSSLKNSKTAVTAYLKQNIARELEKKQNMPDHKPINKMFTYGISGRTVHLHMPTNLMDVMKSNGLNGAISVVNLYLIDAIERIKELKNSGNKEFKMMNQIYMISPILIDRELQFLNDIEFNTKLYTKKDLQSNIFLLENKEAQLAVAIFGNQKNVGTASIDFNTLNTERWNRKKNRKIDELKQRGYSIQKLDEIE